MSTLSNIKSICNYKEGDKPSPPVASISYIDALDSNDEYLINLRKMENRQKVINNLLDEEEDLDTNLDTNLESYQASMEGINTISPRVMSISIKQSNFINEEVLYNDIISYLDSITNRSMNTQSNSLNISTNLNLADGEEQISITRKVITRITLVYNLISMKSKIGPPRTALIGESVFMYLLSMDSVMSISPDGYYYINGIKLIRTDKINKNKFIAIRTSNDFGCGLNVLKNQDGKYFMKETPTFENVIAWFEIT